MTACSVGSAFEVVVSSATSVLSPELLPQAARSREANRTDAQLRTAAQIARASDRCLAGPRSERRGARSADMRYGRWWFEELRSSPEPICSTPPRPNALPDAP